MVLNKIAHIVSTAYGLEGALHVLEGYDNSNFCLISNDGNQWVVKILPSLELACLQTDVLSALNENELKNFLPHVVEMLNGQRVCILDDGRYLFILTWLDGTFYKDSEVNVSFSADMGLFMGKLDLALTQIRIPAGLNESTPWDLCNYGLVKKYTPSIADPSIRLIVDYFFSQADSQCLSLNALPKSLIHGDANDWNVLRDKNKVSGIIDFGDMCYSWRVNEIAISCVYLAMKTADPQEIICAFLSAYHQKNAINKAELDQLYLLIALRLSVSIAMSSYRTAASTQDAYILVSQKDAIILLEFWIRLNPFHATNQYYQACGFEPNTQVKNNVVLEKRRKYVSSALSLSYSQPILMTKAALQYMYDANGDTYLDCVNNICHVGHANPCCAEAGHQLAQLNTNTRYLYHSLNDYAERLLALFDGRLSKVFFVNSGSAATDLALRIAKVYTGRTQIVCLQHGYHGNTGAAIDVSSYKFRGKGGSGKPAHTTELQLPTGAADLFEGSLLDDAPPAAFIGESIVGCGGQRTLPAAWMKSVYAQVRQRGGICIADEVQTGFGRVGDKWWAYEQLGLDPDLVIIGKPMGNGHPMAAVVTTDQLADSFNNGMEFFSSFGGNPVSCKMGLAVLDAIEHYRLKENALKVGDYFKGLLEQLASRIPAIVEVRGSGLFLGVEFQVDGQPATELVAKVVDRMKDLGILLSSDGPSNNVIKIKPPMCFTKKNAEHVCQKLDEVLSDLDA
jgi:ethanolamine-phosphate phospho-lyase